MSVTSTTKRGPLASTLETTIVAALLGLGARRLAAPASGMIESWRCGMGVYWNIASPTLHAYTLAPLVVGFVFALGMIGVLARGLGRHSRVRAIALAVGVALVVQCVVDAANRVWPSVIDAILVVAMIAASAWVAFARASIGRLRTRWLAAPAIVAITFATGFPVLSVTWRDHTQHHAPFTIELAATYDIRGAYVIVADPHPEIVDVGSARYEIDHADVLRFDEHDVGAMKRDGDEIILHITNTEKARALARRSLHRMSMIDALYVNGRRISFPVYDAVLMNGHIALSLHGDADAVWSALGEP